MEHLNWDLSVLSRAVVYSNLSSASEHVGLSQPQLSRIVAKLEEHYRITLLDRDAKRKSSWTPAALKLAALYKKTVRQFQGELMQLVEGTQPSVLRIGALDGLAYLAGKFCHHCFTTLRIPLIELHIYDLSELEQHFVKGDLDFVFTSRQPGRKKFRFAKAFGYQSLDVVEGSGISPLGFDVLSSFEYTPHTRSDHTSTGKHTLVSNSLFIRQMWLEQFGGTATLPSKIHNHREENQREEPVMLIGHDQFQPSLWEKLANFSY